MSNEILTECAALLRTRELLERAAVSESHWRRHEHNCQYPKRGHLGPRARGLPEDVLDLFLAQCLALRAAMRSLTEPVTLPRWSPDHVPAQYPRGIQMVTRSEVELLVGLRHTAIYDAIGDGTFPWPAPLGDRVRRWARHEIDAWIEHRFHYLRALRSPAQVWVVPASRSVRVR